VSRSAPTIDPERREAIARVLRLTRCQPGTAIDWHEHLGLAGSCTKLLVRGRPDLQPLRSDLYHEHMPTLKRCAELFNPRRGYRFSSYAMSAMIKNRPQYINAVNHLGPRVRNPRPRPMRIQSWMGSAIADPSSTDPAEQAELADEIASLRAALDRCTPDDRGLVLLRMSRGLTQRAAAARIGIDRLTAGSRERKLRKRLAVELGDTPGGSSSG
jgi:RNA polymerase sigma factor (sigma-70 family)